MVSNKRMFNLDRVSKGIDKKKLKGSENELDESTEGREVSSLFGMRKEKVQKTEKKSKKRVDKRKKSKVRSKRRRFFLILISIIGVIGIIVGLIVFQFVYSPYRRIRTSVDQIEVATKNIISDFEDKNLANLDSNINTIRTEFDKINKELDSFEFLRYLELTKGYYDNLQIIIGIVGKADTLIEKSLPEFKELLQNTGFSLEEGVEVQPEEDGDEQSTLSLLLSELDDYIAFYEEIEPSIMEIFAEVNKLNPAYLPAVGGNNMGGNLDEFEKFTEEYPETSDEIIAFLSNLPVLIGADNTQSRYLIVMQNETEMRASGGILTVYGSMKFVDGELEDDIKLHDMWNLENYVRFDLGINAGPRDFKYWEDYPDYVSPFGYYQNIYGQNVLMNNGCGATSMRAQDSGLYPDLKWTMDIFQDYYYWANFYNKDLYPDYDHVVIMNQTFVENILSIIQPIEVEGYGVVTAENFIEFIKEETDRPDLVFDPDRKKIIDDIADVVKDKLFEIDNEKIPLTINTLIDSFYARDIAFTSPDTSVQAFFDKYNLSGEFEKEFAGDYLHVNEAQNCSLKLNRWLRDTVTQTVYIGEDGNINKEVAINWQQPQIYDPSIGALYSNTTRYSYRAWVRLFTPLNSSNFDSDGLKASGYLFYRPKDYYDETMNKQTYDSIIQFDHRRLTESDPVAEHNLNISYSLPESLNYNKNGEYKLLLQKHPGKSWGEVYKTVINYGGESYTNEITLDRDKILTFKNGEITVTDYHTELDWVSNIVESIPFEKL